MAALAKGLPVCFVPEQPGIAPMRGDVIHDGCGRQHAPLHAGVAQRIARQKLFAGFPPVRAIAALRGAAPHPVRRFGAVLRAVGTALAQVGTTRIPAGALGAFRH